MKVKRFCHSIIVGGLIFCIPAQAQDYESLKRSSSDSFTAAAKDAQSRFESFRQQANAAYLEKLRAPWTKFDGILPQPVPYERTLPPPKPEKEEPPVPVPAPVVVPAPAPAPKPAPAPVEPIVPVPVPEKKATISFTFHGAPISLEYPEKMPVLARTSTCGDVADLWKQLSNSKYDSLLTQLLAMRDGHKLPDWLYISLVEQSANRIYPSDSESASVLVNYVLVQSGFDVKPSKDDSGKLHILVRTDCKMYDHGCWKLDGKTYYLVDNSPVKSLQITEATFENAKAARMSFTDAPQLGSKRAARRSLKSSYGTVMSVSLEANEDYIGMLGKYPVIYNENDSRSRWMYYARTKLDDATRKELYGQIASQIQGKSKLDAATMILNWVQTAFVYGYDEQIWGEDRPFHSEETLYYPYCDCEDRAVLFSRLVRDILGLEVVLVHYPGHLATAVHFPGQDVGGAAFIVDGKKYVVCDPTFVDGAPVGTQGKDLDLSKTVIVRL